MSATVGSTPPDDPLGALCRDNHVALAPRGTGVLDGTTFVAKDVFDIAGTTTGFGNPDWLATHPPAGATASAVTRVLDAGAHLVGRAISDELTYSLTGENHHYGTPLNSAAPDRIPGGSSSGSASAVAGGLCDFALGTDCGGSVRIPASYCGVIGLRPTHDRIALDGVIPFAPSFDVAGWFARDPALMERVGAVLFGEPAGANLPGRVAIVADAFELVEPAVADALAAPVAHVLALTGASRELRASDEGLAAWFEIFRTVQGAEIWANRREWMVQVAPRIGPGIRERLDWAATIDALTAARASKAQADIRSRVRERIDPDEIWCLPTSPRVAPRRDAPPDLLENAYRAQAMCLLCIAGLAGLPQLSLPLATLDGLPLGLSLIGAPGSDMQLLAMGSALIGQTTDENRGD